MATHDAGIQPNASSAPRHGLGAVRQRTVLFGGESQGQVWQNDTREYDGTTWVQRFPATVPTTGSAVAMVYGTARQRCVMVLNRPGIETWEWDGSNWPPRTSANTPPDRKGFDVAYDSRRQRTVLLVVPVARGTALTPGSGMAMRGCSGPQAGRRPPRATS
jgi:hypothetical protein